VTPGGSTARLSLPLLLAAAGLALAAAPRPNTTAAAPARWRLLAAAAVGQPLLRVGDLLADPGSGPVPAWQETVLAAAPQPGTLLVWSRAQAAARLRLAGLADIPFSIPAQIEVRRLAWPVARRPVLAALAAYLHHPVAGADVEFAAPLTTVTGDPGIAVESSRLDVAHGRMMLVCRARQDAQLLPFAVFLRLPAAEMVARRRAAVLPAVAAPRAAAAPYWVQPGHAAEWHIASSAFSLTTQVMPMQAGRGGQIIRAVSLATHAAVRVQVIGPNQVRSAPATAAEAFHAH